MRAKMNGSLIIGLAALALVRPLMDLVGLHDLLGERASGTIITIGVLIIWLVVVVSRRINRPLLHLMLTGLLYGVFTIVISATFAPLFPSQSIANPYAITGIVIVHAIWGVLIGLIAIAIIKIKRKVKTDK
ncbi:hypothetical protein [Paenibacillus sp. HJGM_3]|uniref:hypothetical protein n=1 Tax=Paenibacillus sp. HJGM_3 TaxID=3379816 RepID=UPI00385C3A6F